MRRHPRSAGIQVRGANWARTFLPFEGDEAWERFIEQEHCLWTCLLFPRGPVERVQDICDLTLLLFATDDAYVDPARAGAAAPILEAATEIMGGGDAAGFAWGTALRDVWARLASRMAPRQLQRLAEAIRALYEGAVREVAWRAGGDPLDFDAYLQLRRESVGAKIYVVLAEYAAETDLGDEVARLRGLNDIAFEHLILTNDVFSFRKEHYERDRMNALSVLHRCADMSLQEIVDVLCSRIEAVERAFVETRAAILGGELGAREDVRKTLEALGHLLSGNLHWSYLTPRYHGAGYTWNGLTSATVTLYPDRTVFDAER